MKLFSIFRALCAAGLVDAYNPCPSTECWTFDSTTAKCSIKDECMTLKCGALAFDITFKSGLFGLDDNQNGVSFDEGWSPEWAGNHWRISCSLGEHGMEYNIDSDTKEIVMTVELAIEGNDRTRTDDIPDTEINLGTSSIITAPLGVGVTFSCGYPTLVEVSGESFTVMDIPSGQISGGPTGPDGPDTPSLADGFDMSINEGAPSTFQLGDILSIAVSWQVTGFPTLTYFINQCIVTQGQTAVGIIKNGCYASALAVKGEVDGKSVGFSYQMFKATGETSTQQTLACAIMLCPADACTKPTLDSQCSNTGDDFYYKYKV